MTENDLIMELYRCMTPTQREVFKKHLVNLVETEGIKHTVPTVASSPQTV